MPQDNPEVYLQEAIALLEQYLAVQGDPQVADVLDQLEGVAGGGPLGPEGLPPESAGTSELEDLGLEGGPEGLDEGGMPEEGDLGEDQEEPGGVPAEIGMQAGGGGGFRQAREGALANVRSTGNYSRAKAGQEQPEESARRKRRRGKANEGK